MEYDVLCAKEGCRQKKDSSKACPLCGTSSSILRINGSYEIEVGLLLQTELASLLEELDRVNGTFDNEKYFGGTTR
ncbi:MAG: hypothetical protein JRG73_04505 [Deltaproteobacteria bacterium]|nr:hypothetical protein [Deltaproteobacteria bacterium]MBW2306177.1 hypothetical protein [Deltaproteobacteria bacterium]